MITCIKNGYCFADGVFRKADLYLEGRSILQLGGFLPHGREWDAEGCLVLPGFVDIHLHGGGGFDFARGTEEAVEAAIQTHLMHGTTTAFPTVVSTDFEVLEKAVCAVERVWKRNPVIGGIHLEGPYLSPKQTGAQNSSALRRPDPREYKEFLEKHSIARWDYAPELDEDFAFLEALKSHGVVPAAAHTDATCAEMERAADRGCRLITHLYSCTSTVRREQGFRVAGVLEAAYLRDDICAELIADGCHLPKELLRLAFKCKKSGSLALVTDAMEAAGLETEGEFDIGGVRCIVEDGVAKLPDRSAFAGSVATSDRLIRTCVRAGIPAEDAIRSATEVPARLMGLSRKGRLAAGMDADVVVMTRDFEVKNVISFGEVVR
ncbi:MAG: amidohydrolase family protein [Clostridia bacterium]|nr:amidohydrolase family protein [Clostridia bacterium]